MVRRYFHEHGSSRWSRRQAPRRHDGRDGRHHRVGVRRDGRDERDADHRSRSRRPRLLRVGLFCLPHHVDPDDAGLRKAGRRDRAPPGLRRRNGALSRGVGALRGVDVVRSARRLPRVAGTRRGRAAADVDDHRRGPLRAQGARPSAGVFDRRMGPRQRDGADDRRLDRGARVVAMGVSRERAGGDARGRAAGGLLPRSSSPERRPARGPRRLARRFGNRPRGLRAGPRRVAERARARRSRSERGGVCGAARPRPAARTDAAPLADGARSASRASRARRRRLRRWDSLRLQRVRAVLGHRARTGRWVGRRGHARAAARRVGDGIPASAYRGSSSTACARS